MPDRCTFLQMNITSTEIDHEDTPIGRLTLREYHAETGDSGHEILVDGAFLMASHGSHSERAMADAAHGLLSREPRDLSVLVGGLGAGHTLRAVLDLPHVARVEVVEIGHKVVDWNRRYFTEFNGGAVDDPRVRIHIEDVADLVARSDGAFDLILLDVDNGPGWLAAPSNARLYQPGGLASCRNALRPGGVLAIWSPHQNAELEQALETSFEIWTVSDTTHLGRAADEPPSAIYLASAEVGKN